MARRSVLVFFFFQAEDGIRDLTVTGVQTCALPICPHAPASSSTTRPRSSLPTCRTTNRWPTDRKSTRLNSSHSQISYAVFCLKHTIKPAVSELHPHFTARWTITAKSLEHEVHLTAM